MKVLKENMEELLIKAKYIKRKEYEDENLNNFLNYWSFFEEKETVIQMLTNESIEVILYSKYYWSSKYKKRYLELYVRAIEERRNFQCTFFGGANA